ncbi:MAG: DnaJ domain-containing protein [Magnetospiraceae bacterium]
MTALVIGVAALGLFLILANWVATREPIDIAKLLGWVLAGIALVLVGWLVLSGKLLWALAALPALLPWILRARAASRTAKNAWRMMGGAAPGTGPTGGQTSAVDSRYLHMELDHESGAMNGTVKAGGFAGAWLSDLTISQLLELWRDVGGDPESQRLLESYLDREHGDQWRDQAQAANTPPPQAGSGEMTREEAFAVLGLGPEATPEEIKAAHRRLMTKLHPDHEGSSFLAAKVNRAREILLGE